MSSQRTAHDLANTNALTTMNARRCLIALGFLAAWSGGIWAQQKDVVGYYPSWKWKFRNNLVSPAVLPYGKLTIINYAFFTPLPDGRIAGKDTVGDALYLRSAAGTTITDRAHAHGVRVLLSLGGWEDSGIFPAISATPSLRAAFAHSCLGAVRQYRFDGIDIDWEFPGYADHNGTASDRDNFTLLLRTLRDSLDHEGTSAGRSFLLTAALPAAGENLEHMDIRAVAGILDLLNIMTYDFYGPWDRLANHNCPLYPSACADSTRCVDAAFRLYHASYGIPASKINLGVPFYGQTYTQCVELNSSHAGADTVHFSPHGAFYYDIRRQIDSFVRHWDDRAQVPYLVSPALKLLISYDDEESIRAKARYVLEKGAHGLIIWEITGDYLDDGSTPLLNTITDVFSHTGAQH